MDRIVALGEMFGIAGRRAELHALLERLQDHAISQRGCRRYVFATTLADPDHVLLASEWNDEEAMDRHYRSAAFAEFQQALRGLLARPSEMTVHRVTGSVRPVDGSPMDPRDAD